LKLIGLSSFLGTIEAYSLRQSNADRNNKSAIELYYTEL